MAVVYSDRINQIKGSDLADVLRLADQPDIISFAGGLPAPELFPVEEMKAVCATVLEKEGIQALQYGSGDGYVPLRKQIAERMNRILKTNVRFEDILITNGSQQGLDFVGRTFCNKGDVILMETPSYLGAIDAFKLNEPTFIEVPTDDEGMIMEELERILSTTERVRMIYVIPDFQNPTGRTWNMERRQRFMEIINKYEIPVIEDNPYGELRFSGDFLPSLKALDTKGLVVFLGTFSKIFAPGMRLGWMVANPEILSKFKLVKGGADLQTSSLSQREASYFIDMFDLDAHVDAIRKTYSERKDAMIEAMKRHFPEGVKYNDTDGGLFTWVVLPEYMDARVLLKDCIANKVAFVPGGAFFPNGGHENCFRLNYSNRDVEYIEEGIKRIGEVIKKHMK